ncbi:hypothetical protein GGR56DRAFT_679038 [Xylariaceae sp. FL0804]|nr:hypothetical protein GGR56DRAFT_679038 [Xylariaceae sp. FL0804]
MIQVYLAISDAQFVTGDIRVYGETFSHKPDADLFIELYDIWLNETASLPSDAASTVAELRALVADVVATLEPAAAGGGGGTGGAGRVGAVSHHGGTPVPHEDREPFPAYSAGLSYTSTTAGVIGSGGGGGGGGGEHAKLESDVNDSQKKTVVDLAIKYVDKDEPGASKGKPTQDYHLRDTYLRIRTRAREVNARRAAGGDGDGEGGDVE